MKFVSTKRILVGRIYAGSMVDPCISPPNGPWYQRFRCAEKGLRCPRNLVSWGVALVTHEEVQDGFKLLGLDSEENRAELLKVLSLIPKKTSTEVKYSTSDGCEPVTA
jgi:hypothetical protein